MPKLKSQVLHNKNIFDTRIVTPTDSMKLFSFGVDKRLAWTYHEGQVDGISNQTILGFLSVMPMDLGDIKQIKMYQKSIHVVLSVLARDHLDDMPRTMYTSLTRAC